MSPLSLNMILHHCFLQRLN